MVKILSQKTIDNLKPGAEAFDAEVQGFGVCRTENGVKSYILRRAWPGTDKKRPLRRVIGPLIGCLPYNSGEMVLF
jgi:hypothetical protein